MDGSRAAAGVWGTREGQFQRRCLQPRHHPARGAYPRPTLLLLGTLSRRYVSSLTGHPGPQTDPAIVFPSHPTVQSRRSVLQIFRVSQPERRGRGTAELLDGLLIHTGLTFSFIHQSPAQWTLPGFRESGRGKVTDAGSCLVSAPHICLLWKRKTTQIGSARLVAR